MDNNSVISANKNNRKAYFAMCRVSALLCVFTFLSWLCGLGLGYLFSEYSVEIQGWLVKLLSHLGTGRQTAVVAVKHLLDSAAFTEFLSMVVSFVTMVMPCMIFAKCVHLTSDECFNTSGRLVKGFFPVFCLCQLITSTASMFSESIYGFIFPDGVSYVQGDAVTGIDGGLDVYGFIVRLLCVCIFVPFAEEYVFRGVMFSYLRRYGLSFAVVASALLFGIAHTSPTQSVYAFVFGVISAFLTAVTGNIKTSVLFHALNNFITVLSESFSVISSQMLSDSFYVIYIAVVSAFSVYGIYRITQQDRYIDVFREKAEENDGGIAVKPGMLQVAAFPLVMYCIYYALTLVSGVFM